MKPEPLEHTLCTSFPPLKLRKFSCSSSQSNGKGVRLHGRPSCSDGQSAHARPHHGPSAIGLMITRPLARVWGGSGTQKSTKSEALFSTFPLPSLLYKKTICFSVHLHCSLQQRSHTAT